MLSVMVLNSPLYWVFCVSLWEYWSLNADKTRKQTLKDNKLNNQKARWGIAGLGKIAHRFVSDLTMQVDNAELYAVAARDKQRADSFSNQYGCQRSYGSYTELANDANVDIVYIATIHPFHKGLVELFLNKMTLKGSMKDGIIPSVL